MSPIWRLCILGLRHPDGYLVWRGFLRLPRMARYPCPDLHGLRLRFLTVGFCVFLSLFPSELAEATRDSILGFLVPVVVLVVSRPS